jgi:hypothetical protein
MAEWRRVAHVEQEIRRAWTYVGVPELRSAYDPPFEDIPRIALPYVSVQLTNNGATTPRIDSRLCPSRPYCIFPREVLQPLGVSDRDGVRARDPDLGEVKLILLDLKVFGDDGASLTTRARIGWPLGEDAKEPVLGSFGFFSAFEVSFSPRHGIRIRSAATKT